MIFVNWVNEHRILFLGGWYSAVALGALAYQATTGKLSQIGQGGLSEATEHLNNHREHRTGKDTENGTQPVSGADPDVAYQVGTVDERPDWMK